MKQSHVLITYLMLFFVIAANIPDVTGSEYHSSEYGSYEPKKYEYHHHHDYHPPEKKSGHVDINIPLDAHTLTKLGIIGLTQLKLLFALGKIATAGLGVSALGLGQLGKLGIKIGPVHKGSGIAVDIGAGHGHHHHHDHHGYESRSSHSHQYEHVPEKHIEY